MIYCIWNFSRFWRNSTHPMGTKWSIFLLFFFYIMQVLVSFLLIGNFYITFYLIIQLAMPGSIVASLLSMVYLFITGATILLSMGHTPTEVRSWHATSISIYALLTLITFVVAFWSFGQMYAAQLGSEDSGGKAKVWFGDVPMTSCNQNGLAKYASDFYTYKNGPPAAPPTPPTPIVPTTAPSGPDPAPGPGPDPAPPGPAPGPGPDPAPPAPAPGPGPDPAPAPGPGPTSRLLQATTGIDDGGLLEGTVGYLAYHLLNSAPKTKFPDLAAAREIGSHVSRRLANIPSITSACPGYQVSMRLNK
jgi:hypothetical protein